MSCCTITLKAFPSFYLVERGFNKVTDVLAKKKQRLQSTNRGGLKENAAYKNRTRHQPTSGKTPDKSISLRYLLYLYSILEEGRFFFFQKRAVKITSSGVKINWN